MFWFLVIAAFSLWLLGWFAVVFIQAIEDHARFYHKPVSLYYKRIGYIVLFFVLLWISTK
jgi:hypothetical protein